MIPTAEQLLSNLPTAIIFWTALTLSWGIYVMWAYTRASNANLWAGDREYVWNVYCTVLANGALITLLVLEPLFVVLMDMVIVINIFYGVYLAYVSWLIATLPVDVPPKE